MDPTSAFAGVRRETPDDTLFYAIYPSLAPSLSASDALSALSSLHLQLNALFAPFLSSFLFHRDPFHLSLSAPRSLPHLHGSTHFAHSISDEWFIVSLLFLASRSFPDLVIRLWDSDGEFLLIEAAFSLPPWLNPDTSTNRVFVHNGQLHIIPTQLFPSTPTLPEAIEAVRNDQIDTRASEAVQTAIQRRIQGYPDKAKENLHRVRVRVPVKVAQVLKMEPCLIALAVEAFYDRDVDMMKHAAEMDKFLKGTDGEIEIVRVSVTVTRAMYGQLVQQSFQAPRCYPMPSREDRTAYTEAELGMKIACGFEMLYQERLRAGQEGKGATWEAFKKSLEQSGCFDGLLPGSQEYKRVLEEASTYYKSTSLFSRTREITSAPVRRIDEILSLPYSAEDFNGAGLPPNDDESWLYDGEDELNSAILEREKEMLEYESKKKQKNVKQVGDDAGGSSSLPNEFNLGDIAASMQEFVRKVSSFEGAEVPDNSNSKDVQLDADQFFKAMESVLNRHGDDGEDSNSEMDFDESEGSDFDEEHGDDEEMGDMFMQSYSDVLNKELSSTSIKKSFVRAEQPNGPAEGPSNARAEDVDEDLTPVDVDFNLMQSLLDSFSSQQGLPGPASNLLGLMGLKVPPPNKDK
ncbi:Protein ecdysoneless [Rhynchospora pubera]|uniref:Protein ecdysoneless n=1 Tax=Rhynchospora pubera TaxID=906938 RepID=A0AAV8D411_9POAL|nr:Protein ecdysoneless [Rhynchospora pubera]